MGERRMEEGGREGGREHEGERKRVGGERKRLRIGSEACGDWQSSKGELEIQGRASIAAFSIKS